MRIKVGCLDLDEIYARSFAESFSVKYDYIFEIYIFHNTENLIAELQKFDIDILIADSTLQNKIKKVNCPILFLDKEAMPPNKIKKFSKAEDFCEAINALYIEKSGNKQKLNKSQTKFILSTGAFGGAGMTTISSSLSLFLSKQYKVLYLNLNPYENVGNYIEGEFDSNFEDIIFNLKSRTKNKPKAKFGTSKKFNSLHLSPPYEDPSSYLSLTDKEVEDWIAFLTDGNEYDYIILEIGNREIFRFPGLMRRAYRILVITNDNANYFEKTEKFLSTFKQFEKTQSSRMTDKLRLIYNRSEDREESVAKEFKISGVMPEIDIKDEKQIIDHIAISKMFMDFI
ncbi:MAG: hypothetical protein Q4E28_01130 [Clostridia bacterium]|nr:hypothetical protein [Clostridia bacterium]